MFGKGVYVVGCFGDVGSVGDVIEFEDWCVFD